MTFRQAAAEAEDSLFGRLERRKFAPGGELDNDAVPQQQGGRIAPAGWVRNSDGDGTATVVIDADGIEITNGALVIKNLGGSVIIDGNSTLFKIAATGTLLMTGPNGTSSAAAALQKSITLDTGLTYMPVALFFIDAGGFSEPLQLVAAWTSGADVGKVFRSIYPYTQVEGVNQTKASVWWVSWVNDSGNTWPFRYYVLKEQAF